MRNSIIILAIILLFILMYLSACQNNGMSDDSNNSILDLNTDDIVKSESEMSLIVSDESYGCADFEPNDDKKDFSESVDHKAVQSKGEILETIDNGCDAMIALIVHDNNVYDYWFFDGTEELLILSSAVGNVGFCKNTFCGEDFLIVYENIIGHAYPANIVAIVDGNFYRLQNRIFGIILFAIRRNSIYARRSLYRFT